VVNKKKEVAKKKIEIQEEIELRLPKKSLKEKRMKGNKSFVSEKGIVL
jgi:hypothetical protein